MWIVFTILCFAGLSGVSGQCAGDVLATPIFSTRISDPQVKYVLNDPVVYTCNQDVGWGHVVIRCQESGWGSPDRECEDQTNIEAGFIAGLVVFLFTLVVVIIVLVMSQLHGRKADADAAKEAEGTPGTSQANGSARKQSIPALKPCKPNSHRRHSVVQMLE